MIALYERATDAMPTMPLLDVPLCDSQFDGLMDEIGQVGLELVVPGNGGFPISPPRAA